MTQQLPPSPRRLTTPTCYAPPAGGPAQPLVNPNKNPAATLSGSRKRGSGLLPMMMSPKTKRSRTVNFGEEPTIPKSPWTEKKNYMSRSHDTITRVSRINFSRNISKLHFQPKNILELPEVLLRNIMSVLERKEKCMVMRTCKAMRKLIRHPEVWDDVKVLLRNCYTKGEEDDGRAKWFKMMADSGAFDHLNTLRVIRNVHPLYEEHTLDEEKIQELEASAVKPCDLEVLDIVARRTKGVELISFEFTGDLSGRFPRVATAIKKIFLNNHRTVVMVLFHTGITGNPLAVLPVDTRYPALQHLNYSGDFCPESNFIKLTETLDFIKLTCLPQDTAKFMRELQKYPQPLKELTIRTKAQSGIAPEDYFQRVQQLVPLGVITDPDSSYSKKLLSFEWNTMYSYLINKEQLKQMANIRGKAFLKISSKAMDDEVFGMLAKNPDVIGLFIGLNSIVDKEEFMRQVMEKPVLKWLRLASDYGPHLTDEEKESIQAKHPEMKFWVRPARKEDTIELVQMWNPGD